MFNTVLIANRGAIASRIIRTLKQLGIKSIAVYAEADKESLHVTQADEAYSLGDGAAATTYLNQQKIIDIAKQSGAQAIHPGYGFLSENATFAEKLQQLNISFIGPRAQQMIDFGLKHQAREIAQQANVPLVPGSGLIADLAELVAYAKEVGFPVMLKSTAGGGGIGMQKCDSIAELEKAFINVKHLGAQNFANDGVFVEKFVEKARHIEVQVIGNGFGQVVTLGERDCSSQRRNQKVIEETPAPNLPEATRSAMLTTAKNLMASVDYLNAGTVEFIYDHDQDKFYFLEVNTRLQVEHGVTEMCYQVDLVEWMLKVAFSESVLNEATDLSCLETLKPIGHAIQARIYAENPAKNFQPSAGLLTQVEWPTENARVDHWVEAGLTVSPFFDPMLAKVIVHANNRHAAIAKLDNALTNTKLYGVVSNIDYVQQVLANESFLQGKIFTRSLNDFKANFTGFEVLKAGTMTTIQDYPARTGYWDIGVPPSGPFDFYSFQLANRLLNNSTNAAGLEITLQGPTLKFYHDCQVAISGAEVEITLDDQAQNNHQVIAIKAGQTLKIGKVTAAGARAYLAVSGGIQCPDYLGSKSTFTLGQFGGHCGRALRIGDFLSIKKSANQLNNTTVSQIPADVVAPLTNNWTVRVVYGPHGAPDFFIEQDIQTIQSHTWKIHYNSSRTGIRLIGPKPQWARETGGEAGLHPSNIHDNAYAFGTVDFTGDMPVILGPDGPSLGGFVCPFTVIAADLWKLGQLKAGDNLNFEVVDLPTAKQIEIAQNNQIENLTNQTISYAPATINTPILDTLETDDGEPNLVFRAAGDKFLLAEYGELVLDLTLRARVQALLEALQAKNIMGVLELTPGIRSLQIHYDNLTVDVYQLIQMIKDIDLSLGDTRQLSFESRIVHLPLSWNDIACQQAIDKYVQSVRKDAPWCPSNLEFIKRINGLESIEQVKDIVFNAHYLVLGLGDVYLGAPVATPLDKCHRLVTTKYNPARTWTAENSVGIGGAYMCIYGMEGPGGYQFVGRTVQMWNRYRSNEVFSQPWLLRFFDQVKYYPVSHEELTQIRQDFPLGKWQPKIESATVSMPELIKQWKTNEAEIAQFTQQREQAFSAEMAEWKRTGALNYSFEADAQTKTEQIQLTDKQYLMEATAAGSVWKVSCQTNQQVSSGESMIVLESMKMEIDIAATESAKVIKVLVKEGQQVQAGQALMILEEA
ncbi:urea amidolyase-like protein [Catenovulum agarivorans DS-2]|uniref:Biotin carboxylase n=1 Tax=Catenovulum agarivorans DS-2 TaxID=1328313 RepID=W7QAL2_9ALTE|nr:urea carboxylase [Catenovulum agarivorans]EWH09056.1 urea amidolyase-like protein [Catenovulum agarivorans DS-2]